MENIYIYFLGIGVLIYVFTKLFAKYSMGKGSNPFISYDKVRNGYMTLASTLYHNCNKKDLEKDLKRILSKRTDGRYIGRYEFNFLSFSLDSFYDILQYFAKIEQSMILDLNQSVSLESLNNFFISSLSDKVKDKSFIENNSKNASFPHRGIISKYQQALNKDSIKIGFFTDNSDSYYLVLFPSNKESIIKKAIAAIGFEYKKSIPMAVSAVSIKSKQKLAYI